MKEKIINKNIDPSLSINNKRKNAARSLQFSSLNNNNNILYKLKLRGAQTHKRYRDRPQRGLKFKMEDFQMKRKMVCCGNEMVGKIIITFFKLRHGLFSIFKSSNTPSKRAYIEFLLKH